MKPTLTPADFDRIAPKLQAKLVDALQAQKADCLIPAAPGETDLLDTPEVDSKTVVQLSPIVETATGHKLKPDWIRKGGYDSIEEAAQHVIAEVRRNCFSGVTPLRPKTPSTPTGAAPWPKTA